MPTGIVTPETAAVRSNSEDESWRLSLQRAVRDPSELCRRLRLNGELATEIATGAEDFPLLVTPEYLSRIRPGDPGDPLLLQVLPQAAEATHRAWESADPVGDLAARQVPGMLQKYAGRVLLVVTGACAIHCRYCFRKAYPYQESGPRASTWEPALEQIAADRTIREVLLSGGDPLMVADGPLETLLERVTEIPHVRRLRIHTRLPILVPARVTPRLVAALARARSLPVVVVHVNHPAELDDQVAAALRRFSQAGIVLLNQAVLLRGINDRVETLVELSERLLDLQVMPYYLHQLDPVLGTAHFAVPIAAGRELVSQLRARLPGYAVPRYVQERPGQPSKTVLA